MDTKIFNALWLCVTIYFLCTIVNMYLSERRIISRIDTLQQQVLNVIKEVKK